MSAPERLCQLAALHLAAGHRDEAARLLDGAMRMVLAMKPRHGHPRRRHPVAREDT